MMPESLSKSRYTAFCQCPKNLWLKVYKPEEAKDDPALEARFEQGNEVSDLAMGLFCKFQEVTTKNADGSLWPLRRRVFGIEFAAVLLVTNTLSIL